MRRHQLLLLTSLIVQIAGVRPLTAQGGFLGLTTLELSTPVGDTKHFVDAMAGAGLGWEGRWTVSPRASTGVAFAFGEFSQRESGTMEFPSGAITGDMLRQLFTAQMLATGYVYPVRIRQVRLYAGGGAGLSEIDENLNLGTQLISRSAWHAVLAPEVGAEIRSRDGFLVGVVSVRFNAALASGDYVGGGSRRFQYITLRLGFGEQ